MFDVIAPSSRVSEYIFADAAAADIKARMPGSGGLFTVSVNPFQCRVFVDFLTKPEAVRVVSPVLCKLVNDPESVFYSGIGGVYDD